ncbi:MAG: phosphatase PAP2 family protein [Muribaculaceae bacterium]
MSSVIEMLQQADEAVFSVLNGAHCGYADSMMWLFTGKWAYVLPLVALLYIAFRCGVKRGLVIVLAVALTVALSDQIASSVIKPLVCRLRPSHVEHLCAYVLNEHRGGMYGFVSSHAANSFGVAMLLTLLSRNRGVAISIFAWAALVSYSRIYLGVHFPGDIVCGAVLGMLVAIFVYWALKKLPADYRIDGCLTPRQQQILFISIALNIVAIFVIAPVYFV